MGYTDNPLLDDEEAVEVGGGTFTQEQVNAIVRDRLRRQRAQLEKSSAASSLALEAANAELLKLRGKAERYNEQFTKTLTDKRKDLPKGVLDLLDKLEPEEQISWLDANAGVLKVEKPTTPPEAPRPEGRVSNAESDVVVRKSQSGLYRPL